MLEKLIKAKKAIIGVIGLGYVGLPLARLFCSGGFKVIGFDIDPEKVKKLNKGQSYILSVADKEIQNFLKDKRFRANSDFNRLKEVDVIIICVPTPLTSQGQPDISYIKSTGQSIARNMRAGQLIILESTTYPGTTREVLLPILQKSGLVCGKDFFLAYSPEREDPGNKGFSQKDIPKVVGGMDQVSLELASLLYSSVVKQVVRVSSCEVAEATKILENVYRCVNIALVNELKMLFDRMKIDVWEVINAASSKPFGFQPFYPGPGLGGHCIPIDPFYLAWKAREYDFDTRFIKLAGEINIQMPYYVVSKIEQTLRARGKDLKGAKVFILGVSYKKDIDDPRESPAFRIMELLQDRGAKLTYNDPYIKSIPKMRDFRRFKLKSRDLTRGLLSKQDCTVIVSNHSCYDYKFIVDNSKLVIDTRNATSGLDKCNEKVIQA